jgi:hypothetical protein
MAYTTAALCKTYMGITTSTDDTLIGTLIVRAQAMVDSYTHRTFEASANSTKFFNSRFDVYGRTLYFSDGLEAATITTITNGDATVIVVNTDCTTLPANGTPIYGLQMLASSTQIWQQTPAGDDERAISIVAKWAYSLTAPDDIVAATIRLVAFLYRQRESNADLDRAVSVGDGMVLLPGRLPADIAAILEPYRRNSR